MTVTGPLGPSARKNDDRSAATHDLSGQTDDATVAAAGKLSEALEIVEHARGLLYGFHRLCGTADLTLQDAVDALREAGHHQLADRLSQDLVGRNVIADMWSFELVEAYDAQYWQVFRSAEHDVRCHLGTSAHQYEAQMKAREQSAEPR
jgi:hypothetical protein